MGSASMRSRKLLSWETHFYLTGYLVSRCSLTGCGARRCPTCPENVPGLISRTSNGPNLSPEAHAFVLNQVQKSIFAWFEPPHVDRPIIFYGVHGGAEWTGASFDPTTGWLYVSANELAWVESLSRSVPVPQRDPRMEPTPGERVYRKNCAVCHGQGRHGKGMAPSLAGLNRRSTEAQVSDILKTGRNAMPAIPIPKDQLRSLLDYLFDRDIAGQKAGQNQGTASVVSYEASGFAKLLDNQDLPGAKPPWGTLNAIDLN